MKTTHLTKIVSALLAFTMLAAACGGDDGGDVSSADQELIDAVVATLTEDDDVPVGVDADCLGKAVVTGLGGADGMADLGVTADSIDMDQLEVPKDQAISLTEGMFDCGLMEVFTSEMTGDGMSSDDAECLTKNLDQDAIRDMMAADLMSDAEGDAVGEEAEGRMFASMIDAMGECDLDPSSLGL